MVDIEHRFGDPQTLTSPKKRHKEKQRINLPEKGQKSADVWEETLVIRSPVIEQRLLRSYRGCRGEKTNGICAQEELTLPAQSGKQPTDSRRDNRTECMVYQTAVSAMADSGDKWEVSLQLRSQKFLQGQGQRVKTIESRAAHHKTPPGHPHVPISSFQNQHQPLRTWVERKISEERDPRRPCGSTELQSRPPDRTPLLLPPPLLSRGKAG